MYIAPGSLEFQALHRLETQTRSAKPNLVASNRAAGHPLSWIRDCLVSQARKPDPSNLMAAMPGHDGWRFQMSTVWHRQGRRSP
jgi:hypothetical protein